MTQYKNFILLERIPKAPPYLFSLADTEFVAKYFKEVHKLDTHPGPHLNIYENGDFLFNYQLDSLRKCTKSIFEKLVGNPSWGLEMDKTILETAKLFFAYSTKIEKNDFNKISDSKLAEMSDIWFFKYFHDSWLSGWPAVLVDFESNLFSNHLLNYLKQKVKEKNYTVSVGDIFSILTTPAENTYAEKESISLLELLSEIQQDQKLVKLIKHNDKKSIIRNWPEVNNNLWQKFIDHYKNYCWLPFMYIGPPWNLDYFVESIIGALKQDTDAKQELEALKGQKDQVKILQAKYYSELKIHDEFKTLFTIAEKFVYSKSYRKDAMYYSCYAVSRLLKEIARRVYLSLDQVRAAYPWEIKSLIAGHGPSANVLNSRKEFAVQYSDDNKRIVFESQPAKEFIKKFSFVQQSTEKPSQILGDCACVGKVRGLVKIINSPEDMAKMERGNILLSYATSPDIMPAIKKAIAIVTDLGGIICHAAIVSRELKIPCVVGTKIATQVLKDGDLVEVDATHGIVRLIN